MPATYSRPNVITLGSLDYIIDGEVQRQPAEEFSVGLRFGPPSYDSREGVQFRTFNDFRGGMGIRAGDHREYPDRFWQSRDVRTWDSVGDVTLAPRLLEASLGTIVPSFTLSFPGGGWAVAPRGATQDFTLFGAMGNKVFRTTSVTTPVSFTDITPGGGPASASTTALVLHQNPTNVLDKSLYWCTGSQTQIWKFNVLNETWSQPNTTSKGYADDVMEFDGKLLKIYHGQIAISADGGATWTGDDTDLTTIGGGFIRVPHNNNFLPFFIGSGLDGAGQVVPYVVSAGELYALDIWTRQAIRVELGLPSSITCGITWQDGEVIVSDGHYVKAYHPDRPVRDMGLNRDHGLETFFFIRSFVVVAGKWLVAQVDDVGGTVFGLFMWDGKGWHVVNSGDAINGPFGAWPLPGHRTLAFYNGSSLFNPNQILYVMAYGSGHPYIYLMKTDAFRNPQMNGNHQYAGSVAGWIETAWFDGGFAEMDGTAIEVELHGVFNGSAKQITVKYRTDNSTAAYTTLGSTSGTSTIQRIQFNGGKGISFKNIQFEIDFIRNATDTNTPVLRAMVFKYVKVPRLRSIFSFNVNIEETARFRGVSAETVIDTLYSSFDDTPLIDFGYLGEGTFFVKPKEMPRVDQLVQDGAVKIGVIHCVVEEPVG